MRPGVVVANRFRIERIAGVGGMGTVFQATDLVAGGSVALKFLTGIGEHDAARFVREAVVLAELVHPGIVRYLAHGLTTDHEHYLAMEWLEGETLHDRLGRGRLSVAEALVLGRALAEALAVAHARGVVHRDIKPMNLFLPGGELAKLKVLDFGIARLVKQVGMLTHTGAVIGTPGYMAPEQVRGEPDVDASTDVFGVGCVLYHCLTGVPAFSGNPIAVLAKILLEDVRPLGELVVVPRELDELVLAMLHKDRAARPANGRVVASELARIAAGELSEELSSTVVSVGTLAATATTGSRVGVTAFERRLVSLVLMLPIAESSDEELHQVAMVATTYRGKLVRIVDGANLVVFGHAETAPDHAARAARCALALRELHPTARYVVASGRAAVGAHLVGEVIDRAVAESVGAPSGQIVIDDATSHLLDERFAIEGDRYLWGIQDGTEHAHRLLGRSSLFVGRDREVSSLDALWAASADDRVAHVVLVTSPPGGGKSRLRQEFVQRVLQRDAHAAVWIGRGDSLRAGSPFSMIADATRRVAGVREGDSLEIQRDALRARVARHVAADDIDRVTHLLGEIAGVPFPTDASEALRAARADAMVMGDAMKAAWIEWLAAECAHHPVLLVLEDLHWGDKPSLDLVAAALRDLAGSSLLVLALARPEVHDTFPRLWANRDLQEIRLPQLTRKASERLVRDVLGPRVATATVERVVERAAGNAFFLEELIRAVAEGRDDRLPDSVLSMLQLRLDALGTEAKRVLRAASVFGEVFWRGGVAALLGDDPSAALATLVEGELVTAQRHSRMPGEVELTFRHGLVQQAAYETLDDGDRIASHRLAGEWLVAHGHSDAIALAGHFSLGNEPRRAAELFARAAEQANAGNDTEAVFAYAQRGLDCEPTGDVAARLHNAIAEAHNLRGLHVEAIEHALRARGSVAAGSRLYFQATDEALFGAGRSADIPRAIGFIHDLTTTAAEADAELSQLRSVARAAIVMWHFGPPGVGAVLTDRVEELATRIALDPGIEQRLHTIRGLRARSRGDALGAIAEHEAGLRACHLSHNARELAFNHLSLGVIYTELGALELALPQLESGLQVAERIGASTVLPLLWFSLGICKLEQAAYREAREDGTRALALAANLDLAAEAIARWVIARAALGEGELSTAEHHLAWCHAHFSNIGALRSVGLATHVRLALARGEVAVALQHAAEAKALMRDDHGFEEGENVIRLAEIEAFEAAGDHVAARRAAAIAIQRLELRATRMQEPWRSRFLAKPVNRATLARRSS